MKIGAGACILLFAFVGTAKSQNLVINGSAERGWYCVGKPSPRGIISWLGEPISSAACGEWTIDDTESYFGKRSFKGVYNTEGRDEGLFFNPIKYHIGKYYYFSAYIKASQEATARMSLYVCSGNAYTKEITVTTRWQKYFLEAPEYGEEAMGVSRIGNVTEGGNGVTGIFTPRIVFNGPGTVWIDGVQVVEGKETKKDFEDEATLWLRAKMNKKDACYFIGDGLKVDLEVENATKEKRDAVLYYTYNDYFGNEAFKSEPDKITLEAAETAKKAFVLKPKIKGAFNIRFFAKDVLTNKIYDHNLYLGMIDPIGREPDHAPFGVNLDCMRNVEELIPYLKLFGVGSVRVWPTYSKKFDRYMGFDMLAPLKKAGLKILVCLNTLVPKVPQENRQVIPKDLVEWSEYIKNIAGKYKGLVDYYEILNEPNIWGNENSDPSKYDTMSLERYVKVLKTAYGAIKGADPTIMIAGPTPSGTDLGWISRVFAAGGGNYLDALTEHPYREAPEAPDYEQDLKGVDHILKANHKEIEKIASEVGWVNNTILNNNLINETEKWADARNIRLQIMGFANGLSKFMLYECSLRSTGWTYATFLLGNPDNDYTSIPNTYMFALRNLIDRIGGAQFLEKVDLGAGIRCYIFEKEDKKVAVLWKYEEEDKETTVRLKGTETAFHIYNISGGDLIPIKKEKDAFSFNLTGSPCYLETDMDNKALLALLSSAEITGMGDPFKISTAVLSPNDFAIDIQNRTIKPISGTVEILSDEKIVQGDTKISFNDIMGTKRISCAAVRPIGATPVKFKIKTILDDKETFDVSECALSAMLCKRIDKITAAGGEFFDWRQVEPLKLTSKNAVKSDEKIWKKTDDDISALVYAAWDDDNLYVAVEVNKEIFFQNEEDPASMWRGDSLQVAFDPLRNGDPSKKVYGDDDFEYGVALMKNGVEVYRYNASSANYDGITKNIGEIKGEVKARVTRENHKVIYEMAFPQRSISPFRLKSGNSIKWNLIVNLNNGQGRMGWLEVTPGIGQYKSPGEFIDLILLN